MKRAILIGAFLLVTAYGCTTAPTIQKVTLQRMGCYGACPVYTVMLAHNGSVTFLGDEYVRFHGKVTSKIAPRNWQFLVSAVRQANFFELQGGYSTKEDGCDATVLDTPSLGITVISTAGKKQVFYNLGCHGPKAMAAINWLANTIDFVANTQQWVDRN